MLTQLCIDNLEQARLLAGKIPELGYDYISLREKYFQWQFIRAAELFGDGDDPGTWLYVKDQRAVSLHLGAKARFWVNGHASSGIWVHDLYIDPNAEVTGPSLAWRQVNENGLIAVCGIGIPSAIIHHAKFPSVWIELRRLFGVIDAAKTGRMMTTSAPGSRALIRIFRRVKKPRQITGHRVEEFSSEYEKTWKQVRNTISFCTDRTAQYMTWRYMNDPYFKYETRRYETPAGPAYFVWRREQVSEFEETVARICEVIGSRSALACAYPAVHSELKMSGVAFCDFYCTHEETMAGLMEGGMKHAVTLSDFDVPRLFQPFAFEISKTINFNLSVTKENAGSWLYRTGGFYITKGDGNQDRFNPVVT